MIQLNQKYILTDKGKLVERQGRKAMGLRFRLEAKIAKLPKQGFYI